MPSPFPGMDPFIEDPFFWPDFHASMIGIMREMLNGILPAEYVAAADRNVWVQELRDDEVAHLGSSDVHVATRDEVAGGSVATLAASVAAPVNVTLPMRRANGDRYLQILDRRRRRVVTVIELLGPSNKTASGNGLAYRAKRADYRASNVNLVEIDLLRRGQRPTVSNPPPAYSDYCILVCAAASFPHAGYWPLSVRDKLPQVPIPLGDEEAPVLLDLRGCIDRAYDGGRYFAEIDYGVDVDPPLSAADAIWAKELLARNPATP